MKRTDRVFISTPIPWHKPDHWGMFDVTTGNFIAFFTSEDEAMAAMRAEQPDPDLALAAFNEHGHLLARKC